MIDYKQILTDYLGTTLGKSDEEVLAILFKKADDGTLTEELSETAINDLKEAHAEHLKTAPSDLLKAKFDEGHKAGKFETLSKVEDHLQKTYSLDKKGDVYKMIAEAATKAATITEDKVLTHPAVVSRLAEKDAEIETVKAQSETAIAEANTKAERQMRFSKVLPTLDSALAAAGVSQDFLKPATKQAFLAQFDGKDFEFAETGTYIKNADGTLQKDKHGNPVKLEAFVASTAADWFPIEKQPGRKTPGNDDPEPPPITKWTKENLPKSGEEFNTAYYNIQDPKERTEFAKAYQEANQGN